MEEIAEGIFVETGYEGVNVAAIMTEGGLVCIDAPSYPRDARDWVVRLERLYPRPIRFVILTDCNGDRLLNTRWLNAPIVAHASVADRLMGYQKRYPQPLIESLIKRNPKFGKELANNPVDRPAISFANDMTILSSRHTLELSHRPGPTMGNLWVYVADAGILFTGDSVVNGSQPYLAELIWQDWLESLAQLSSGQPHVAVLVPGRGEITDLSAAASMQDYLNRIREIVVDHFAVGGTREELAVQAEQLINEFQLDTLPEVWVQGQVLLGMERIYDDVSYDDVAYDDVADQEEGDIKELPPREARGSTIK